MPKLNDEGLGGIRMAIAPSIDFGGDEIVARITAQTTTMPWTMVVVAHSCPVVSAGIASTLCELSTCQVEIANDDDDWRMPATASADNVILIGDLTGIERVRLAPSIAGQPSVSRVAKLLIAKTGDKMALDDLRGKGMHACLPIDCRGEDLLRVVSQLGDARPDKSSMCPHVGGLAPGVKRRVREYIDPNLPRKTDIDTLAAISGLSNGHFSRAFKQTFGSPPYRYVTERRVAAAANLIRTTDRPLIELALELGFADQSHFTRIFTKIMRDTPRSFRHRHR